MSRVRFGLIGYGAWGSHHARAIGQVDEARLEAIAARSGESQARARADHPQARVYANYAEMLDREDLDVVSVVLPSDLHFEVGQAVLRSGRHLLLEKPMALKVEDCTELIRLARDRGRVLAVGHELRLSSLWGRVKQEIDSGRIGEPNHVLIELWRRPYRLGSGGWRYDLGRVGSWILEEPIHFFDLARWYFEDVGEPVSVYASAVGWREDRPDLLDNFSAMVQFPRGRYAVISQTLAGWEHHQTVKVTGSEGAIWARWSGSMDRTFDPTFRLQVGSADEVEEVPIDVPSGEVYELVDEVRSMVRAVRDGEAPACSGEDGRWSVALCLKAEQSRLEQSPMPLFSPDSEAR